MIITLILAIQDFLIPQKNIIVFILVVFND